MTSTKTLSISAQKRDVSKSALKAVRSQGLVPAVVYGHKRTPLAISVGAPDMLKTYRAAGHSSLVTLDIAGEKTQVLIHEVVRHPIKEFISHVDFFAVNLKEKTTVEVPLVFKGESLAVKNLGALLMKECTELNIRCLPTEIPAEIVIDIAPLQTVHSQIKLKDLNLDQKYEVLHLSPESTICSAIPPKIEKEETTAPVAASEVPSAAGAPATDSAGDKKEEPKKEAKK